MFYCNAPYLQELIKFFSIKYKDFIKESQPNPKKAKK